MDNARHETAAEKRVRLAAELAELEPEPEGEPEAGDPEPEPVALTDKQIAVLSVKVARGTATPDERASLRSALKLGGGSKKPVDPSATRCEVQPEGTAYSTLAKYEGKRGTVCSYCSAGYRKAHKKECRNWREVTDASKAPLLMVYNEAFRQLGEERRVKYGPSEALILLWSFLSGRFEAAVFPALDSLLGAFGPGEIEPQAIEAIKASRAAWITAASRKVKGAASR